jgi:penicillin-binding protein 1A
LQVPLRIYTQDNQLIQEYGEKKRIPVTYNQIPPQLIHGLLATEDQRFFEHSGVDIFGLGRATIRMIKTGTKSQGGSTITMQVARNFFLSRKKTFLRKFNEILLAIKIEHELNKEKILELYLNRIYLGNRAYGVGAAAEVYYGKPLQQLTLAELAMIAGLPQAPSSQNPIANPVAAKKRRNHVLARMREENYISEAEYQEAIKEPVSARYHGTPVQVNAPYVAEMIRQSLFDHYGKKAYTKGYKVYTTIHSNLQTTANDVVSSHLLRYDRRHGYRGPVAHLEHYTPHGTNTEADLGTLRKELMPYPVINHLEPAVVSAVYEKTIQAISRDGNGVSIAWSGMSWARPALRQSGYVGKSPTRASQIVKPGDIIYITQQDGQWFLGQVPDAEAALIALNPNNGGIEALVGGFNFVKSKFNRATQSLRQPGSSFKPFLYAAALNKGNTLATLINNGPIVVDDPSQPTVWRPHNDKRNFGGPTRLKEALVHSLNLVSIRILDDLGFDYAIDFATRFGFDRKQLPRGLSLALGSLSISPMDLTRGYAVFANGGFRVEPYLIDHITDNDGKLLLQAKPVTVCAHCPEETATSTPTHAPRVIPEDVAFFMYTAMQGVIQRGTGSAARVLERPDIAGKTGTTNDQVDAWFAGFNPDLVVTTWVGFDTPQPLHEYAATLALPMWIDFMKVALKTLPEKQLPQPENVVAVRIDPDSGLLARPNQANAVTEYFREQDIPTADESTTTNPSSTGGVPEENLF